MEARLFWPGHLFGGRGLIHRGRACRVAYDYQVKGIEWTVPVGHVPIWYFCHKTGKEVLFSAPLDDLVVFGRKGKV